MLTPSERALTAATKAIHAIDCEVPDCPDLTCDAGASAERYGRLARAAVLAAYDIDFPDNHADEVEGSLADAE